MASDPYIVRVSIAIDVCINVILGGVEDMTISTRAGEAAEEGRRWGVIVAGILNYLFPSHCEIAEAHDKQRAAYVEWLLKTTSNS